MHMKNLSKSVLLGASLVLAPFVPTQAQSTWQTVEDFQYSPGVGTVGRAVTVASDGSVYRLAYGGDASGANHSVLHRSTDGGTTWTPLLDDATVNLMCLAEGAGGVLWTAGQTIGSAAGTWLTYRSTDGGVSGVLVDQLSFPKGTVPNALAADAAGRVFVCGRGVDAKGATRWIVRRTLDGGATWSTSDNFIVVAWRGRAAIGQLPGTEGVRLFKATWTNPAPESAITRLEFQLGDTSLQPLVVAITAE